MYYFRSQWSPLRGEQLRIWGAVLYWVPSIESQDKFNLPWVCNCAEELPPPIQRWRIIQHGVLCSGDTGWGLTSLVWPGLRTCEATDKQTSGRRIFSYCHRQEDWQCEFQICQHIHSQMKFIKSNLERWKKTDCTNCIWQVGSLHVDNCTENNGFCFSQSVGGSSERWLCCHDY